MKNNSFSHFKKYRRPNFDGILAVHRQKNAALGAAATMSTHPPYTDLRSPQPASSTLFSGIIGIFGKNYLFCHEEKKEKRSIIMNLTTILSQGRGSLDRDRLFGRLFYLAAETYHSARVHRLLLLLSM